jgi:hypothetical protein
MTTVTLKYMFSLTASLPKRMLGETPAGHRFDVEYRTTTENPDVTSVATDPLRLLSDWAKDLFDWARADKDRLKAIQAMDAGKDKKQEFEEAWTKFDTGRFGGAGESWEIHDLISGSAAPKHPGFTRESLERLLVDVKARLAKEPSKELEASLARLKSKQGELDKYDQLAQRVDRLLELFRKYCADQAILQPWLGLRANIISGVDWALLRADGVVEFDGQLTLRDGPQVDRGKVGVLVNARTSGVIDLISKGGSRPSSLDHALSLWLASDASLPVALNIRFEAPQEPEPWASKKYTRRKGQMKYAALSRGQFVGCGFVKMNKQDAATIDLDVFQAAPNLDFKLENLSESLDSEEKKALLMREVTDFLDKGWRE